LLVVVSHLGLRAQVGKTALPGAKTTAQTVMQVLVDGPQRPRCVSVQSADHRPHRNRAAADRGSGKSGFPEIAPSVQV